MRFCQSALGFVLFSLFLLVPVNAAVVTKGAPKKKVKIEFPFSVGGRLYSDYYQATSQNQRGTILQSNLSAWLDVATKKPDGLGLRAIGQFDAFYKNIQNPNTQTYAFRLREGYVSYLSPSLDLRIGQLILPWGKSDGINPTDYFTAKDLTLLNPDEEVKRIGAFGSSLTFTPLEGNSPLTFQFVLLGTYPRTRLLIPTNAIPSGVSFRQEALTPGYFQTNTMEFGGKISYLAQSFDLSLSAFQGYNPYPQYIYTESTQTISPIHVAQTAVGGDASFTYEEYVFRLESAVFFPENGRDTDPMRGLVQPWHWDSVIGLERPIGDDFRIQGQFLYRWHLHYENPVLSTTNPVTTQIVLGVARFNALILNYQRQGNPGASFRLAYAKEGSDFTADLFFVGYFSSGEDYLVRPSLGYTPITNLKFIVGADLYGGNPNRPLGALYDRSDAFFEAKYVF